MSDGTPQRPTAVPDQATRDIRLPPLPDRSPPAVPPAWASYVPAAPSAVPDDGPAAVSSGRPREEVTDRLAVPGEHPRQGTLAFDPVPLPPLRVTVGPRRNRSRWVWALLVLLTVGVIAGSGLWLLDHFGVL